MHKNSIRFSFLCVLCFLWFLLSSRAEIIDRIVAVVDNRIITLSDIRQERTLRAAFGESNAKNDQTLLQELIETRLIQEQIGQFPGVDVTDDEVQAEVNKVQNGQGLPLDVIREGIRARLRTGKYFELRFRRFIRPGDEEERKYYDEVFVPEARARGLNPIPPLDQVAEAVRSNIVEEKMKHEIEIWLEAVRRRSEIEVFQ